MITTSNQNNISIFAEISQRIIKEQELIIGPIAREEARKVSGLTVSDSKMAMVSIIGDGKQVVDLLVSRYTRLFGRVSQEVCKEATQDIISQLPQDQIPTNLR